jgi:hypothetical protein
MLHGGNDLRHVCELGAIGFVGEIHADSPDSSLIVNNLLVWIQLVAGTGKEVALSLLHVSEIL